MAGGYEGHWLKSKTLRWSRNIETPWLIGKVMVTLLGDVL